MDEVRAIFACVWPTPEFEQNDGSHAHVTVRAVNSSRRWSM